MTTFDGWETELYGDVIALPRQPSDELAHHGTRGMKWGRRRFQTESGEWTPVGLKERAAREGWGEKRAKRKAERLQRKSERRAARKERIASVKKAIQERRNKNSLKNLSDDELRAKINRLKLEKEYKDLNKNPALEAGAKIVKAYFDSREARAKRKSDKANLIIRQQEALSKLRQAQANKIQAKNDVLDNIIGGKGKMKAKNDLIKTKAENTILGALRKGGAKIIGKETSNIVKEMPDHSITLKAARKVKSAYTTGKDLAKAAYAGAGEEYLNRKISKYRDSDVKKRKKAIRSMK